jgi:two-component system response regulator AdeR
MGDDATGVLVVDDERRLADLFGTWLRGDREVAVTYDGEAALEALDDDVGVVLLDRRMPGLSGDEVLEEIRARESDVRVVMVTAVDPDFDIIEMGFDDYVVKPVSKDDLLDVVERMESRSAYDRTVQRYYSLASKKALLESEKPASELEDSGEYQDLVGEFEELREEADAAVDELSTKDDFESAFRGLSPDDPDVDGEQDVGGG